MAPTRKEKKKKKKRKRKKKKKKKNSKPELRVAEQRNPFEQSRF